MKMDLMKPFIYGKHQVRGVTLKIMIGLDSFLRFLNMLNAHT